MSAIDAHSRGAPRRDPPAHGRRRRAVARLAAAGVRVVEITLDSDDALGAIERARGRGDVTCSRARCASPPRSTPRSRPARRRSSRRRSRPPSSSARPQLGVPAIPGALTPTEIETAWRGRRGAGQALPGPPRRPALRPGRARAARRRPAARDRRRRCDERARVPRRGRRRGRRRLGSRERRRAAPPGGDRRSRRRRPRRRRSSRP